MVTDIRAAVREAMKTGLKVGVVGHCMGGTIAWLAATGVEGMTAAVDYYGGGIADAANERPRCLVLLHWGETGTSIPPERIVNITLVQIRFLRMATWTAHRPPQEPAGTAHISGLLAG